MNSPSGLARTGHHPRWNALPKSQSTSAHWDAGRGDSSPVVDPGTPRNGTNRNEARRYLPAGQAGAADLDDLVGYVKRTLPLATYISNLEVRKEIGVITFRWQGREFLVKPSLEVLEKRGQILYITGSSMLLRSVLTQRERVEKVLEAASEVLMQVEDVIGSKGQRQNGLKLLEAVEASLRKLIARPVA